MVGKLKIRLVCGKCHDKKMYPVEKCMKTFDQAMPDCCGQSMLILGNAADSEGPVYEITRPRYVKGTTPLYIRGPYRKEQAIGL